MSLMILHTHSEIRGKISCLWGGNKGEGRWSAQMMAACPGAQCSDWDVKHSPSVLMPSMVSQVHNGREMVKYILKLVVVLLTEQEFAKNVIKTSEGAKANVTQQV